MLGKIVPCGYCGATGRIDSGFASYSKTMCPVCLGRRNIQVPVNAEKCRECKGTGRHYRDYMRLTFERHVQCHGTGWVARPPVIARAIR
jgi:hypothetical protein